MKRVLADDGVGIFAFTSLDDVAFASKLLNKYSLSSTLYKDSENQCYYLSLTDLDDSPNSTVMDEIHQLLSEYCKRLPNTYATKALFNEHLTTIIEKQALKKWLLIKTNEKESPNILCSWNSFFYFIDTWLLIGFRFQVLSYLSASRSFYKTLRLLQYLLMLLILHHRFLLLP